MLKPEKVLPFLDEARAQASKSKELHTKVGAIILDPEYGIATSGWNGFARGINDDIPERWERPEKYNWMIHAEMNAMSNAARRGRALMDCELLIFNNILCSRCAGPMLQAGIRAFYVPEPDFTNDAHKRLMDEFIIAQVMIREAGRRLVLYKVHSPGNEERGPIINWRIT